MSSDLEPSIAQQAAQPTPKKTKKKSKSKSKRATATNEGDDDPHWAYTPPEGAVLLDHAAVDATPFDYDAIKEDSDLEIWLIRAPDTIKPKDLETLSLDPPSEQRALLGALTHETVSYDVWSVGDDANADAGADGACDGAEELGGLTCLFPRRRKRGKLYLSPKEVSQRLVIRARHPAATTREDHPAVVHRNPPRQSYPQEVLKHAFVPYGARSRQIPSEDPIDVDAETTRETLTDSSKETPAAKSKSKKRKADGASPKKSKKHKSDG